MKAEQQTPEEKRTVPIMTIHSNRDCTVNKKGSENIRDSWLERYGASSTPLETKDCTQEGVPCAHKRYGTAGRSVVETVFYEGESGNFIGQGSHYWVGDNSGEYANSTGPSASELLWDFFTRHPYAENQAPSVAISSESASGTSITLSGSASDADGSIAEVAVALEGKHPQSSKPASGTNSWSVVFANVPDNAFYTAVATAKDNKGATASIKGNPLKIGNPPPNKPPSVSIETVTVTGICVSVSGKASDIDGTVKKVEVELGSSGFKTGALDGNAYSYEECALKAGTYTTHAKAIDNLDASTTTKGGDAKVEALKTEVSDWQAHMSAGRLKVYRAPCSSIGFGSCDTGFHTIFLTHSFNSFALYKDPASDNWYLDPGSIRASVR
jgi:hypothetical protein